MPYLCSPKQRNGPVAQLNRVSDYGSEGYRFESCRGHMIIKELQIIVALFFYVCTQIAHKFQFQFSVKLIGINQ